MDIECPECGALNKVEDENKHELIDCWNCRERYEYDPLCSKEE